MGLLREGRRRRLRPDDAHLRGARCAARRTADALLPDAVLRHPDGEGIHLDPLDGPTVDQHRRPSRHEQLGDGFPLQDGPDRERQDVLRAEMGRQPVSVHSAERHFQVLRCSPERLRYHSSSEHGLPSGDRWIQLLDARGRRSGGAYEHQPDAVHGGLRNLLRLFRRTQRHLHVLPHEDRRQHHPGLRLRAGGERSRRHRPLRPAERRVLPEPDGDAVRGRRRAAAGPRRPRGGRNAHVPLPSLRLRRLRDGRRGDARLRQPRFRTAHALRRVRRNRL